MSGKNKTILIRNGHIWNASDDFIGDIFVSDGKIAAIGNNLKEHFQVEEIIDADGLYVFPGGVDPHTHLDLPFMGTFSADDFETGTLAGLYGGTTSIVDLALQSRGSSLADCISHWHEKADGKAVGDYAFHCGITDFPENVKKEFSDVVKDGITSFKVFMAYKGALMIDDRLLLGVMEEARKYGAIITVHAENGDMVDAMVAKYKKEKRLTPEYHALAHPASAEAEAAGRVMDLAFHSGAVVYLVHTSCGEALKRAQQNYKRNQRVFVETCPQYLLLDDSVYKKPGFEGAKYVMSPPIRTKQDQEALWSGLQNGNVQTIGTDHCPFNFVGQKDMGKDDFTKIPNGAPGIEHRLELLFSEGVLKNRITLNRLVEVLCTNPAAIFGLSTKGSLMVGKDADIVLFNPDETHTISSSTHHHNVDNSIYEGWSVTGKVKTVLSNGKVVIRNGKADEITKGQGRYLKRQPYNFAY